jgi:HD-like signal output (HDOD) protein
VELETTLAGRHAEFGGFLVTRWRLPKLLQDPIVWHHEPDRAAERPLETAVIYVANRLAHRYGFGCPRQEVDIAEDPLFARVNVDAAAMARFDDHVPGLFAVARKITA